MDAKFFLRDLSLPFAYFCAKKGIQAKTITVLFLFISLVANVLLVIPSIYSLIVSIIIYEIAQLLDCIDGQVARYSRATKSGENLDSVFHTLIDGTFMIFFGIRLFLQNNQVWFIVFGALGAFFRAFDWRSDTATISIIDNQRFIKLYYDNRPIRYMVYVAQTLITEVRFFILFTLFLTLVQAIFSKSGFVELNFLLLVLFTFLESFLYKVFLVIENSDIQEIQTEKDWL